MHMGLGDTICEITCFFGIHPCAACRIRQQWCNKWFPYKWNLKKTSPDITALKNKILTLKVDQYPFIMDDDLETVLPLECLAG
jgi:hypothetical protein